MAFLIVFKQQEVEVLERLAARRGMTIVVVDTLGKRGLNGAYVSKTNTLYIAADNVVGSFLRVAGHEVVHYIRRWNKKGYNALVSVTRAALEADGVDVDARLREIQQDYKRGFGQELTEGEAMEELVAESFSTVFMQERVIEELYRTDEGTFHKIVEQLKKFISDLKAAIKGTLAAEARAMEKAIGETQAILDCFLSVLDSTVETESAAEAGGTKMSISEYLPAITEDSVHTLQTIVSTPGKRVSVNDFSGEELKKAEAWARRFWKELNVKSPFFRAWFGDWRYADKSVKKVQEFDESKGAFSGNAKNADTQRTLSWDKNLYKESTQNASKEFLGEIELLAGNIDSLVENCVLLDSVVSGKTSKRKMQFTAFMHSFYGIAEVRGKRILYKIYAEEALSNNKTDVFTRAYSLKGLKKVAEFDNGVLLKKEGLTGSHSTTTYTVADLYNYVKRYDKDFTPTDTIPDGHLLNDDGTPKVFYHGTSERFDAFDASQIADREGSFFFAENREDAAAYGEYVYEVYLTGKKFADYDNQPLEFYQLRNKRLQVEWLKARGYDGWYADMDSEGWGEVSVFNNTQIKSATDNIGTFDETNPDIRFSYTPTDEDYPAAVNSGDMETAQRMVEDAAKAAGYGVRAYHGTTGSFTVFDKSKSGGSNSDAAIGFWVLAGMRFFVYNRYIKLEEVVFVETEGLTLIPIAHIETDFDEKFGIPRQSGRVPGLIGRITFTPAFRNPQALRALDGFSHLWLIFDFSGSHQETFSPTVRPPRLGGNRRIGVFASRSPFRPNPLGLSAVRLEGIEEGENGPVLIVSGVDLLSGTPIYDIKPYLPFADAIPEASAGYAGEHVNHRLSVEFGKELLEEIPAEKREALCACLAEDPRPSYHEEGRSYTMRFAGFEICFSVCQEILTVISVKKREKTP